MDAKQIGQIILDTTKMLNTWDGVVDIALVGSALYMPAEEVGDVDFAMLLGDGHEAMQYLEDTLKDGDDWDWCGEYDTALSEWGAIRRENVNLMITHSRAFFEGFKMAAQVCKVLRLQSKLERIAVHRVVRDCMSADEARAAAGLM